MSNKSQGKVTPKIIKLLEFSPQQLTLSLASSRSHENETISRLRARLHGAGEPHEGEVTRLRRVTRLHDRWGDNMRDYVDRQVTPPKRVTSPAWVHHLHVNRPLKPAKTTDISQRQQRFPRKMTSAGRNENEGRNSTLLMTYHRPDLGGASDWLKQVSLAP